MSTTSQLPSSGKSTAGSHRLSTFAKCPAKFGYSEMLGLKSIAFPSPGLATGSLGHIALANLYSRRMGREGLDPVEAMRRAPAEIAYEFHKAMPAVEGYLRYYASDPFNALDVEREFEANVLDKLYTQRADLIAEFNGTVIVVDHKFLARFSSSTVREYVMSGQMLGYELFGQSGLFTSMYGLPWGGVYVNIIRTSGPWDDEAFLRTRLMFPPGLVEDFRRALVETYARIDVEADPWSLPKLGLVNGACMGRGGACEFQPLCLNGRASLNLYRKEP